MKSPPRQFVSAAELYGQGDYQAVLELPQNSLEPHFSYFRFRSLLTLGRTKELEREADALRNTMSVSAQRLAVVSRLIYQDENLEGARTLLEEGFSENEPFFQAEYFSLFGFLNCLSDQWRQAIPHFLTAKKLYANEGASALESVLLFNLALCHNHLGETSLLKAYYQELEQRAAPDSPVTTRIHFLRLQAYLKLEACEYKTALELFRVLRLHCRKTGRIRDYTALLPAQVFLYSKLEKIEEAHLDIEDALSYPLSPPMSELFLLWRFLCEIPFVTSSEAQKLFRSWGKKDFTKTNYLFLLSVLAEKCLNARDYRSALKLSEKAEEVALKSQQNPYLYDFWSVKVRALLGLGYTSQAEEVLGSAELPPNFLAAEERNSRIRELREKLRSPPIDVPRQWEGSQDRISLDFVAEEVKVNGRTISLKKFSAVQNLLRILAENRDGIEVDRLFEKLYGGVFHAQRHASRLHSLLTRTRKILGAPRGIERKDKTVRFSSSVILSQRVSSPGLRRLSREKRAMALVAQLDRTTVSLSISDLERLFKCTRRTLQQDLKSLIQAGVVVSQGNTRNRSYELRNRKGKT